MINIFYKHTTHSNAKIFVIQMVDLFCMKTIKLNFLKYIYKSQNNLFYVMILKLTCFKLCFLLFYPHTVLKLYLDEAR